MSYLNPTTEENTWIFWNQGPRASKPQKMRCKLLRFGRGSLVRSLKWEPLMPLLFENQRGISSFTSGCLFTIRRLLNKVDCLTKSIEVSFVDFFVYSTHWGLHTNNLFQLLQGTNPWILIPVTRLIHLIDTLLNQLRRTPILHVVFWSVSFFFSCSTATLHSLFVSESSWAPLLYLLYILIIMSHLHIE